jgi:hypothetical protein
MRTFLEYGWGEIGMNVFDAWQEFNERFFDDKLKPCPIVLTATSPFGHWAVVRTRSAGKSGWRSYR